MGKSINYTIEPPNNFEQLLTLYESLGWNSLKLTSNDLARMCNQSWYAIYRSKGFFILQLKQG